MIWVAEIGSMHRGSKELAHRMIYEASLAGATIAKFQLGWPKKDKLRHIDDWVEDLDRWCTEYGVEFMASIWSEAGLEAARSVNMKRYKIAHQMRDERLLDNVFSDGKDTFVSLSPKHVEPDRDDKNMILLSTSDEYPTAHKDVRMFSKFDGLPYGYSDHTIGNEMCWLAVSRGAQYIEKHFTLDSTNLEIRDNSFSATPAEFKELVDVGNRIARVA